VGVDRDRVVRLNEHVGEVPEVAYVDHESENGKYAAPLQVRGGERGVLRPRVLDEHRHVRRRGDAVRRRAGDGTEYQYGFGSTEDVDDLSINLTGLSNTQTVSDSGTGAASNSCVW